MKLQRILLVAAATVTAAVLILIVVATRMKEAPAPLDRVTVKLPPSADRAASPPAPAPLPGATGGGPAGFAPISALHAGGAGTPEEAMETEAFLMVNRDFAAAGKMIAFSAKARPVVDAMYGRLPPALASQIGSANEMWVTLMSANPRRQDPVGRQFVSRTANDDGSIVVRTSVKFRNDTILDEVSRFIPVDGKWLHLVEDNMLVAFYTQPNYTARVLAEARGIALPDPGKDKVEARPNTMDQLLQMQKVPAIP